MAISSASGATHDPAMRERACRRVTVRASITLLGKPGNREDSFDEVSPIGLEGHRNWGVDRMRRVRHNALNFRLCSVSVLFQPQRDVLWLNVT